MTILFAASAAEAFAELPDSTKRRAASLIELLEHYPKMCPLRRRGRLATKDDARLRYFVAGSHLFYYSLSSQEVRIAAIMPGAMRRA